MEEQKKMVDEALRALTDIEGLGEIIFSRLEIWEAGGLTFKDFEEDLAGVAKLCSKLLLALKAQELQDSKLLMQARQKELEALTLKLSGGAKHEQDIR